MNFGEQQFDTHRDEDLRSGFQEEHYDIANNNSELASSLMDSIAQEFTVKRVIMLAFVYVCFVAVASLFFFFVASDHSDDHMPHDSVIFKYIGTRRILNWKRLVIVVAYQLVSFVSHVLSFLGFFQHCKNMYVKGPLLRVEHLKVIYREKYFIRVSIGILLSLIASFLFAPTLVTVVFGV